jgi:hypothetical protein
MCTQIKDYSQLMNFLCTGFESVMRLPAIQQISSLHEVRQQTRMALSSINPLLPLTGSRMAVLGDLFDTMDLHIQMPMTRIIDCCGCQHTQTSLSENLSIDYLFYSASIRALGISGTEMVSVQRWIDSQIYSLTNEELSNFQCASCPSEIALTKSVVSSSSLPLLSFYIGGTNAVGTIQLVPSMEIRMPSLHLEDRHLVYKLVGVTYFAHSHFTSRIFWNSSWWDYDGMHGVPIKCAAQISPETFLRLGDALPTHYLYQLLG